MFLYVLYGKEKIFNDFIKSHTFFGVAPLQDGLIRLWGAIFIDYRKFKVAVYPLFLPPVNPVGVLRKVFVVFFACSDFDSGRDSPGVPRSPPESPGVPRSSPESGSARAARRRPGPASSRFSLKNIKNIKRTIKNHQKLSKTIKND